MANVKIEESWKKVLGQEFEKRYFKDLTDFVRSEYKDHKVFPPPASIFNAFDHCPFDRVKVVLIGQDPYHGENQANGLCFSVNPGIKHPPSLQNIFKEMKTDLGLEIPESGDLSPWSERGVLLLNATLTVRAHQPGSHQGKGWEEFTDSVIHRLSEKRSDLVFILWGAYAQKKGQVIDRNRHYVIESPHPSPFSANRGFFGSKPFSQCNTFLKSKGIETLNWSLTQ